MFSVVSSKSSSSSLTLDFVNYLTKIAFLIQCNEEAWDKIFDVNVKSAFFLAKLVVPEMRKRGGGSMVFVSSIGGFHPIPVRFFYFINLNVFNVWVDVYF